MEWMFLIIFIIVIGVIVYGHVYLHISYTIRDGNDDFRLKIYLFNFLKIYQSKRRGLLQNAILKIIDKFIPSTAAQSRIPSKKPPALFKLPWTCRDLSLKVRFGVDNAAYTAIGVGIFRSLCPLVKRYFMPKIRWTRPPVICIEPEFQKNVQVLLFKCILSVKIGHLFYILKNTSQKQEG